MALKRSWLGWIVGLVSLPVAAIAGTWLLMSSGGQILHPDPRAIPSAMQAEPPPEWSGAAARARRILRDGMAGQNLPGLSAAVGVGGEIVWAEGFGWADVETQAPVTPETRFRIGTASAALTSAAVGLLLEEGRLTLDDDIQIYVPQFPETRLPVTLRQLMAHTAGLGSDGGNDGPLFRQRCEQPVAALPHFADGALLFAPGTQRRHSNYGWILASAAVEAAAEQRFLTLMRERIFLPLGMDDTGAESAAEENPERIGEPAEDAPIFTFLRQVILEPLGVGDEKVKPPTEPATVYSPGFGYDPQVRYGLHVMRPHNLSCYAGAMAFFSTPSDLVRFGLALNSGALLRPDTVELLQTPQQLTSGQGTGHGLGWDLETVTLAGESAQAAGLDGELLGRRVVTLRMFRDAGIVVALTANLSDADTATLGLRIAEAFAQPLGP